MRNTNGILVVLWSFEKKFQSLIKKVFVITLIIGKFWIMNANLWSICSKRFDFMV